MFCSKCGAKNPDGVKSCTGCGAVLDQSQTPAPNMDGWEGEFRKSLQKMILSPLVLITIICYSVIQAFHVLAIVDLQDSIDAVYDGLGMNAYAMELISPEFYDVLKIAVLVWMLTGIVTAVGLWVVYVGAIGKSGKRVQTTGLSIVYVVQTGVYVLLNLALCYIIYMCIMFLSDWRQYHGRYTGIPIMEFPMQFIILISVIVFLDVVYFKLLKSIRRARDTIYSAVPDEDISGLVGMMCMFFGALIGMAGVIGWIEFNTLTVMQTVTNILFGFVIAQYKDKMYDLGERYYQYIASKPNVFVVSGTGGYRQDAIPAWKRIEMENQTDDE